MPTMLQLLLQPYSLLSLLLLIPLFFILLTTRRTQKTNLPPSPPKLPIIGNLHQVGALPHRSLYSLSKKHGPLMLLHLGEVPMLVVSSPEMAQVVMRTRDHIFASRPLSKGSDILFYGAKDIAFGPYSEQWRQAKKLCTMHLLSAKKVQSFKHAREEEVSFAMAKIYKAQESSKPINLSELLNAFANDITCRVVSGKFFREGGRNILFRELIERSVEILGGFNLVDFFPSSVWMDFFTRFSSRAREVAKRWDDVLEDVIKEHSMKRVKGSTQESGDFVDVLLSLEDDLQMEYGLTKDHLKALLLDLIFGGTDTSYITLEWAMAELMKDQKVMKKLQEEIRKIVNKKRMVKDEDLIEMSYLRAVIKEILRLHPAISLLIPRESMEDCQIERYLIPKGTKVIINAWTINRDPKFWEAAEEFHPERFIENSIDYKGNNFQFIPFGAGRRICPGLGFAISSMELMLANLVYHFDWELPRCVVTEEINMAENPGITMRMKENLYLIPKLYG
ncbi:indole-2-monooxygenase-like [Typha angustifolia]|uniref:indole-2-monooxygenase-like n=1 Tax=Typha angustifolia TaxID=59011 RepID=UPI003C2B9967